MKTSNASITLEDDTGGAQTSVSVTRVVGSQPHDDISISLYVGRSSQSHNATLRNEEAEALYTLLGMVLGKKS